MSASTTVQTEIHSHTLPNGLVMVAEPMPSARSLAMSLRLPAGLCTQPDDALGATAVLSEWVCRGAGDLKSREHVEALDQLGVHRSTSAGSEHLVISASMLSDRAERALPLLLNMATAPRFDEAEFGPSRELCLQAIEALHDEPQERVMLDLRGRHFPEPFGRSSYGQADHLEALTADRLRDLARAGLRPGGAILGFAGRFDWPQLRDRVASLTESWTGTAREPQPQPHRQRGYQHHEMATEQVHIGIAFDAPPETDDQADTQRYAAAALSGGMSGRLFTEVREKRGLCYAVNARYTPGKRFGTVIGYVGTTTARAQETLDVYVGELRRLSAGIERGEFDRARVGLRSNLVMQGESTAARAGAISRDQHVLGRPRTLDERLAGIEAVNLDQVNGFLAEQPVDPLTLATLGSQPLSPPQG